MSTAEERAENKSTEKAEAYFAGSYQEPQLTQFRGAYGIAPSDEFSVVVDKIEAVDSACDDSRLVAKNRRVEIAEFKTKAKNVV